jgi:hypothetical protein
VLATLAVLSDNFDKFRAQKYYQDKVLELQEQNQAFVHKIKKLQTRLRE